MNYLSYRIYLYKLNRKRDKEDQRLSALVEKAEASGGREVAGELYAAEHHDLYEIEAEIAFLQGQFLISKAQKMQIPTPSINTLSDLWEINGYTNKWQLTSKGLLEVRKMIRKERKEQLEIVSHWSGIIIGVIGAITGLVAVFLSMR